MKKLKTVLIIIIGLALIVYAGYKLNLFPKNAVEEASEEVHEKLIEIVEPSHSDESKSLQEKISDNLDSGLESNKSREEEKNSTATDFEKSLECFYVTEVVDGDTIWVTNDSYPKGIKVRYIGIDTPESVADETSSGKKNTKEGELASSRNKELIEEAGFDVYLEYDSEREDQYGRTLAYVYIFDFESGEYVMLEKMLLSEGLCQVMSIEPNTKYEEEFKALEDAARKDGKGFWGTGFYN